MLTGDYWGEFECLLLERNVTSAVTVGSCDLLLLDVGVRFESPLGVTLARKRTFVNHVISFASCAAPEQPVQPVPAVWLVAAPDRDGAHGDVRSDVALHRGSQRSCKEGQTALVPGGDGDADRATAQRQRSESVGAAR